MLYQNKTAFILLPIKIIIVITTLALLTAFSFLYNTHNINRNLKMHLEKVANARKILILAAQQLADTGKVIDGVAAQHLGFTQDGLAYQATKINLYRLSIKVDQVIIGIICCVR